jgi:hypothetical protein
LTGVREEAGLSLIDDGSDTVVTPSTSAGTCLENPGRFNADVSTYLPFELRHPGHPNEPVTIGMLLDHRSGLDAANHQFA